MECKNTSIKSGRRTAFTLIELMLATGLSLVIGLVIALLVYYSNRSFVAMGHYTDMGQLNRLALDKMSLEIRQARALTAYATNSITLTDVNSNQLQFTYDPAAKQLLRLGGGRTNIYLKECDAMRFWIYQHTVISNTFDCYVPATLANARVVQMTWKCSREILGKKATTDNAQSAIIALRNH